MKRIKGLLNLIILFCYCPINQYEIKGRYFKELKYTKYRLYQIAYICMCIPILVFREETDSLTRSKKIRESWYFKYNINHEETIDV